MAGAAVRTHVQALVSTRFGASRRAPRGGLAGHAAGLSWSPEGVPDLRAAAAPSRSPAACEGPQSMPAPTPDNLFLIMGILVGVSA